MSKYGYTKIENTDPTAESKAFSDFSPTQIEKEKGTSDDTPSVEDYSKTVGKTYVDLIYPFFQKIKDNIYMAVPLLFYALALTTGNLKNATDLIWASVPSAIIIIIYLASRRKKNRLKQRGILQRKE